MSDPAAGIYMPLYHAAMGTIVQLSHVFSTSALLTFDGTCAGTHSMQA